MSEPRPDVPLLADLDAGLLDEPRAAVVRAAAAADPRARAVLHALVITRAQLADLPDPPVPSEVAAHWDAALSAAQALEERPADRPTPGVEHPDTGTDVPAGPRPPCAPPRTGRGSPAVHLPAVPARRRAVPRRPAVLAAVLLLAVLVGAGWLFPRTGPGTQSPSVVEQQQLAAFGAAAVGVRDAGGFDDAVRRAACLRSVAPPGVAAAAPLVGGRHVTFEGRTGVLLVLGTGRRGTFDVVVVDPACDERGGTLLASVQVPPP